MNLLQQILLPKMNFASDLDLSALKEMPCYIYAKNLKGKYLDLNPALARDLGLKKPEDFFGFEDFDMPFLAPEEARNLRANDERVINGTCAISYTEPVSIYDGSKINLLSYKAPLYSRTKKVLGIIGISMIQNVREQTSCDLTQRQLDCLVCLVKGMTMKKIANTLNLSSRTVEHYLDAVKTKLNCLTRFELIDKALKMDVVKDRI